MITCPNCRGQLPENAQFCKFCGSQLFEQPPMQPQQAPDVPPAPKKKKSSKPIVITIVAVVLVIAIVLGVIFLPKLFAKSDDADVEAKLTEILETSTNKPIVEMVCKDYDSDGTYEAYAIVGETDDKDAEHPEFYDADIYFVTQKKAQPIKENISGQVNGTIDVDENTYISIEVYDEEDSGKSFVYTVDNKESAEADISGEFSKVHEENGRIVAFDDYGKEIIVHIDPENNKKPINKKPVKEQDNIISSRLTVDSSFSGVFAVRNDGTVVCANQPFWMSDREAIELRELRDVVSISASVDHVAVLKSDGTVFVNNGPMVSSYGGDLVSGWIDIIAVETGFVHTVGLKSDGTVVATEIVPADDEVIATYGNGDVGQSDVSDWSDIAAISVGVQHTVGLKKDGTVVAVGSNDQGQCDVEEWNDIVAISAGYYHTVGLKKDGTVVATGYIDDLEIEDDTYSGQCDVEGWTDIVAVSAGDEYTLGLKKDGTVVVTEYYGQKYHGHDRVENWTDIVAVSAGDAQAIGLKKDGTVVVTECDIVSEYTRYQNQDYFDKWSDIKMPY